MTKVSENVRKSSETTSSKMVEVVEKLAGKTDNEADLMRTYYLLDGTVCYYMRVILLVVFMLYDQGLNGLRDAIMRFLTSLKNSDLE